MSSWAEALGYIGGGLLAICLIPQIVKIIHTRSTRDIALSWALLYIVGLGFTLAYLIIQGAIAAWIPLIFEIAGSLLIIFLKLLFENTHLGRRLPPAAAASEDAPLEVIVAAGSREPSKHGGAASG